MTFNKDVETRHSSVKILIQKNVFVQSQKMAKMMNHMGYKLQKQQGKILLENLSKHFLKRHQKTTQIKCLERKSKLVTMATSQTYAVIMIWLNWGA